MLFSIFIFTSCASVNAGSRDFLVDGGSEGYALFTTEIPREGWSLSIFQDGDAGPFAKAVAVYESIPKGKNLFFLKLPEGKYMIRYLRRRPYIFELESCAIVVTSGKINYEGTLQVNLEQNAWYEAPRFSYRLTDDFAGIEAEFRARYSEIASRYEITDVAANREPGAWKQPNRLM